ncbi:diketogulonate reductase-like aldo/keto reductase [Pontibacter ummariensis]|uniref:Aldo/keto reductase n=1 Tax=Pontibacter ummariensis TaxID=1610492 RepID=A0A239CWH3_9BACT|nr:aldo/keto reductase [Pontibacter ummariensis]PRY14781.1 diketogulonate reductase-like aldo/keto reductase [Pontibacter ummariensis]SNS24585.1 Aldo/keto reductase [Pontibacter ummariensis]
MKNVQTKNATVPALGFGTFQLEGSTAQRMVTAALETGYRHIDTAQMYNNEEAVGRAIQESGVAREEVFLTTKVLPSNLAKKDFLPSVAQSLQKLKTEQVDLLLIHWPNPEVPVEEYIGELVKAQEKGYTKHIGVSNHTTALLDRVLATGANIITNQVEYHPFLNQDKLYAYLRQHDITLTAYSPIAHGKVMGNPTLKSIGEKYNKNEVQITLRWLIQQEDVLAIPRSSKESHMQSNFNIFDFELTQEEMQQIGKLTQQNNRLINPSFAPKWD